MVAAAELIQLRVVPRLHPHHQGEVGVEEGVPLQFDGRKEESEGDEVAFLLVQPQGVVDLGGEFESSEMQEGEGDLPLIRQTRDDSLEQKGVDPATMTALVEAVVVEGAVGDQEEGEPLGVAHPAEGAVEVVVVE